MFPYNDVIMTLLETPFSRRSEIVKKQILFDGHPTIELETLNKINGQKNGVSSRSFKVSWYDSHK